MRNVRQLSGLRRLVGGSLIDEAVKEGFGSFVDELRLVNVRKPRDVIRVSGPLWKLQDRMLRRVLMPNLSPGCFSHGGVTGRSPKSNALEHLKSRFVYKADVSNFFPSIHRERVHRFFREMNCSPDMAHIATEICTYDHHLALGLVTSPFLADQLLRPVDNRIAGMCKSVGIKYTRYVDDITISGNFDFSKSGIPSSVTSILNEHGFSNNSEKAEFSRIEDCAITGIRIRIRGGKLDVSREYIDRLSKRIADANMLASGQFTGSAFLEENQLKGRVHFVSWVNPGRRGRLIRRLNAIDWNQFWNHANAFGLVAKKSKLIAREMKEPKRKATCKKGRQDGDATKRGQRDKTGTGPIDWL